MRDADRELAERRPRVRSLLCRQHDEHGDERTTPSALARLRLNCVPRVPSTIMTAKAPRPRPPGRPARPAAGTRRRRPGVEQHTLAREDPSLIVALPSGAAWRGGCARLWQGIGRGLDASRRARGTVGSARRAGPARRLSGAQSDELVRLYQSVATDLRRCARPHRNPRTVSRLSDPARPGTDRDRRGAQPAWRRHAIRRGRAPGRAVPDPVWTVPSWSDPVAGVCRAWWVATHPAGARPLMTPSSASSTSRGVSRSTTTRRRGSRPWCGQQRLDHGGCASGWGSRAGCRCT